MSTNGTTNLTLARMLMERMLTEAIVEGVTEVQDGRYTLRLQNAHAVLYADGERVCQRPIDQETVGEQCEAFYYNAGLC